MKKFTSLSNVVLACVVLRIILSTNTLHAQMPPGGTDSDGDGLIDIRTIEQLNNMRHNLAGTSYKDAGAATGVTTGCPTGGCNGYELLNDLDFADDASYSGAVDLAFRPLTEADPITAGATVQDDPADGLNPGFVPIGDATTRFKDNFNGNGFEIHNLYINTAVKDAGFFGETDRGSTIQNIGFIDAYVRSSSGESNSAAGVLAGRFTATIIQNCYATGNLTMRNGGSSHIGGLAGVISATAILQNSYVAVTVLETGSGSSGNRISGLVGTNAGTIKNCYATGTVSGGGTSHITGGLVGQQSGMIQNCYATGAVTGGSITGGFVGYLVIGGSITNSYFDATTTTQALGEGSNLGTGNATSQTTEELQGLTATTTSGWSENDWDFGTTSEYPALRSYATTTDGTMQVAGTLFCNQPTPRSRVDCPPTLISSLTTASTATSAGSALVETSATAIAYNLGEVQTGGTATFTYTLSGVNLTGNVTLAVGGTDATAFSIAPSADLIPSSRGSITATQITVTFTPTEGRMYEATITHSGGGLSPDVVLTLTGLGTLPPPTLTLETSNPLVAIPSNTYDFGNVITPVTTAPTFVYTITGANLTGDVTLSVGGTDPTAFSIAPSADLILSSGAIAATQITVTFTPTEERMYEATITHSGGGLVDDVVLTLTGTSYPPTLTLETGNPLVAIPSNTYDFGNVTTPVTTAPTLVYTITGANLTGDVTLAIGGTDATAFSIAPSADLIPSSGAITATEITVTFTPTEERIYEATITHSGGGLSPDVVLTLTGTSSPTLTLETGSPLVAIPSNTYDFGNVITPVTTAPTFVYTITGANLTGDVTLSVGGTDPTAFSITPSADLIPSSGAITATQITVTFTPTEERMYEATITHSGGGLADDVVLTLTGTSYPPILTLETGNPLVAIPSNTYDFRNVTTPVTTAPTFVYTIEGANLTGNVTLSVGGTDATAFSIAPSADLIPSSGAITATQITVTFTPTDLRMYEATITHSGGGLVDDVVLTLTGTGIDPTAPRLTLTPMTPATFTGRVPNNAYSFGNVITSVTTAPTFVYTIEGANLTGNVTLTIGGTDPTAFSIAPSEDLIPSSGAITATQIMVTFTPTDLRMYEAIITHSGGGLSSDVVLTLTGTGIPPPPGGMDSDSDGLIDIRTIEQLNNMRYNLAGTSYKDADGATGVTTGCPTGGCNGYELLNDLNFVQARNYESGAVDLAFRPLTDADPTTAGATVQDDPADGLNPGFVPIGNSAIRFTGNFNGNGFEIRNLYINTTVREAGFFGRTDGGITIQNIGFIDAYVRLRRSTALLSGSSVGILAGGFSTTTVQNCYAIGNLTMGSGETSDVGGLVGIISATAILQNSYAAVTVLETGSGSNLTGGLVGNNQGTIKNCYATGAVIGTDAVGGLAGLVNGNGTIKNCYATGAVTGTTTGGLVGFLFGGTITNSYFDAITTKQALGEGTSTGTGTATSLTTEKLQELTATTTSSWSENDWDFGTTSQYPALRSYATATDGTTQVAGTVLTNQPCPRVDCPLTPSLTIAFFTTTNAGSALVETSATAYNLGEVQTRNTVVFTYILSGVNLTSDIMLTVGGTDPTAFSITPSADLIPLSGAITATQITVTFTPTDLRMYEATITHSGGGLADDVVLTLTGTGTLPPPTLTLETGNPLVAIPSNTYDFRNVITSTTAPTFVYMIEGVSLTGNITLSIGGTDSTVFSIAPSADLVPSSGAIASTQITVTFMPTEERMYEATITHSGGGLSSDVVLTLTGTGTTTTDTTVGIEDNAINTAGDVRLYPNPSRGRLFVRGEGTFSVSVRNLLGVELLRQEIVEANTIDLSALPAGLYFVQVQGDNGSFIQRIIKK